MGFVGFWVLTRYKNRSIENIGRAFPEKDPAWARSMARRSFENLGRAAAEAARLTRGQGVPLVDPSRVTGGSALEGAIKKGRGAVVVSAHMGCWELVPAYFAAMGLQTGLVVERQSGSWETALLRRERKRIGVGEIVPSVRAFREAIRILAEGGIVVCALDRDSGETGIPTTLVGRSIRLSSLPVRLAGVAGAPLLAAGAILTDSGLGLDFEAPAEVPRASGLREKTAALAAIIERWIRERPDQWVWFYAQ